MKRIGNLVRRDEVDVGVDAAGGQDVPFTGQDLGRGADLETRRDTVLDAGVAGLADRGDPSVANADVRFVDAGAVDTTAEVMTRSGAPPRAWQSATVPCRRESPCRRRISTSSP